MAKSHEPQTQASDRRRMALLKLLGRWLSVIIVSTLVLIGLYLAARGLGVAPHGQPTQVEIAGATIIADDDEGRPLWSHRFAQSIEKTDYYHPSVWNARRVALADLTGDGEVQTLFVYTPQTQEIGAHPLYCFSATGQLKWEFVPGRTVADDTGLMDPPYYVNNILVIPAMDYGTPRIAVSSSHYRRHANQVAILDNGGRLLAEYWHSGPLPAMALADLRRRGRPQLLFGGVNRGLEQAVLVVLDPDAVAGASAQPANDRHQLRGFGPGTERAVIHFPRTCVSRAQEYNWVCHIQVNRDQIVVGVNEGVEGSTVGQVFYQLDYDFKVIAATPSVSLIRRHEEEQAKGKPHHSSSDLNGEFLKRAVVVEWESHAVKRTT